MDGADDLTPSSTTGSGNIRDVYGNSNSSSSNDIHGRPSVGFPLGTALLLIIIFCISGIFSCCYHWDKLRSLRGHRRGHDDIHVEAEHRTPNVTSRQVQGNYNNIFSPLPSPKLPYKLQDRKLEKSESLPVIMPGDNVPKFMAWPCPCPATSQTTERIVVQVVLCPTISSQTQSVPSL